MNRKATIEHAAIEDEHGAGDGAYDLLDVTGTPAEVAAKVAEALAKDELDCGSDGTLPRLNHAAYLTIRIRIDVPCPRCDEVGAVTSESEAHGMCAACLAGFNNPTP